LRWVQPANCESGLAKTAISEAPCPLLRAASRTTRTRTGACSQSDWSSPSRTPAASSTNGECPLFSRRITRAVGNASRCRSASQTGRHGSCCPDDQGWPPESRQGCGLIVTQSRRVIGRPAQLEDRPARPTIVVVVQRIDGLAREAARLPRCTAMWNPGRVTVARRISPSMGVRQTPA
jgi:hypothetical protein